MAKELNEENAKKDISTFLISNWGSLINYLSEKGYNVLDDDFELELTDTLEDILYTGFGEL